MIDDIRNWFGDIASGKIKDAHIALTEAQNASFIRDLDNLLRERDDLLAKVRVLETSLADSIAENRELAAKLAPAEVVSNGLDDDCRSILLHFFESDQGFTIDQIAHHFKFHPSVAKAHFDTLRAQRLVSTPTRIVTYNSRPSPSVYTITSAGRSLAMKHRNPRSEQGVGPNGP